jgi:hypothetical protein
MTHTDGGTITPGPRGYSFAIVTGSEVLENNDFGNYAAAVSACPQNAGLAARLTRVVCDSNCGGTPSYPTLQAAYDAVAGPNEVVGTFNTTENVLLYTKFPNVTVAQCTLARVTAVNSALPTIRVTATDPLIIIGLDTVGGTDGWLVESDKHDIRASGPPAPRWPAST